MRNLTKVLAMVLAFTMIVSVAAFAASYTDVASDANYAEAVSVLSDLGLVKGMGDGTFGADKTLTRAEAATFVVRLIGLEDAAISAAGSETGFTDVPTDHWASGYIYIAAQKGIVAGMGDGTFEPETELEYAQIVKMIVVALGYEPQAAEAGEWPGNYISTASNIGLTKGISGKATDKVDRGTTARLIYAALTIPKMEKSGVGVNATYEPVNKMILDELGIDKILTSVQNVDAIAGKVTLDIESGSHRQAVISKQTYKEVKKDHDDYDYDYNATIKSGALTDTLKNMVGVPAYVFVTEVDDDATVVAIVEKKNVSSVVFESEDWEDFDSSSKKLSYYINAEQTKTASVKLDSNIGVRINGADSTKSASEFSTLVKNGHYTVDLKDTDGDDKYDYANLTHYQYMVVDEVKSTKAGVYTIKGEALSIAAALKLDDFKFDTEDDDTAVTFIKDGEEIGIDEIAEGDILNAIVDNDGLDGSYLVNATVYVTDDVVEGVVRYVDDSDSVIVMDDGVEFKYYIDDDEVTSQDEATFYLSMNGKIIYVDTEAVQSKYTYAFATNLALEGKANAMKTGTIRVLSTEGKWATLDLKSSFTLDGTKVTIKDVVVSTFKNNVAFQDNGFVDDTKNPEFAINGIIAYKTDAAGAVKEIVVIKDNSIVEGNKLNINKTFKADEDEATFGSYTLDEATVVYNYKEGVDLDVNDLDEKDVTVTDINILKDDEAYTASLYNVNEKTDYAPIIAGEFAAEIDFEDSLFVVSKVVEETIEDVEYISLVGFQDGEEVTYYVSADDESEICGVATSGGYVAVGSEISNPYRKSSYSNGDILIVKADAAGIISKAVVMGTVTDFEDDGDYVFSAISAVKGNFIDGDDEGWVVTGFVAGMNSKGTKVYLDVDDDEIGQDDVAETLSANEYSIKNTKVTVYDFTQKLNSRISEGSTSDIDEGTVVIGRSDEDNNLVEVIVIITDATENY